MTGARREWVAFAAVVRKEWIVLMRYWPNTAMVLGEAVLMPLFYWAQATGFEGGSGAARAAFAERAGTANVPAFIYLGWAVFMWVSLMIWGPGAALRQEKMQGSLESLVLTPVSRFSLLHGPAVAHLIPTLLIFSVVGTMLRLVFGVPLTAGRAAFGLAVLLLAIPAVLGLSALVSVVVMGFRDSAGITSTVRGLIGLLCGVTYPLVVLPEWVHPVSWAIPVTVVVDSLRTAVLSGPHALDLAARAGTLLAVGVAMITLGHLSLGLAFRRLERTGRMGQF